MTKLPKIPEQYKKELEIFKVENFLEEQKQEINFSLIPRENIETENIFKTTNELKEAYIDILKSNKFDETESKEIIDIIIWNEDILTIFLKKYKLDNEHLNPSLVNELAGKIYEYALLMKNGRPQYCDINSDNKCASDLLNNKRIVSTICYIANDICSYFHICNKIAYVIENRIYMLTNKTFTEKSIWYITKDLIRELALYGFESYEKKFFIYDYFIEKQSRYLLNYQQINNLICDELITNSLKYILEWHNTNFKIIE